MEAIASSCLEKKVILKEGQKELPPKALNCPRCNSSNTKFCYYNNYSQTQPRYFCKACKRYWTQGGSLRNIPVGGKIRKNKRQQSSSASSSYSLMSNATKIFDSSTNPNPPNNGTYDQYKNSYSFNAPYLSPMELVSSEGIGASSRGSVMASFMPLMQMSEPTLNPNSIYPAGFSFQGDYRPSLGFSLDDFGRVDHDKEAHHDDHQDQIGGHHQHGDSTAFWNGNINLGGGGTGSW